MDVIQAILQLSLDALRQGPTGQQGIARRAFLLGDFLPRLSMMIGVLVAYDHHFKVTRPKRVRLLFWYALTARREEINWAAFKGVIVYVIVANIVAFDVYHLCRLFLDAAGITGLAPHILYIAAGGALGFALPHAYFHIQPRIADSRPASRGSVVEKGLIGHLFSEDLQRQANSFVTALNALERNLGKQLLIVYGVGRVDRFMLHISASDQYEIRHFNGKSGDDLLRIRNEGRRLKQALQFYGPRCVIRHLDGALPAGLLGPVLRPRVSRCSRLLLRRHDAARLIELGSLALGDAIDRRHEQLDIYERLLAQHAQRPVDEDEIRRLKSELAEDLRNNINHVRMTASWLLVEYGLAMVNDCLSDLACGNVEGVNERLERHPREPDFVSAGARLTRSRAGMSGSAQSAATE